MTTFWDTPADNTNRPASATATYHWESMTLGEFIRAAREQRGWSRQQLADRCGLSERFIQYLEAGDRTEILLSSGLKLARALSVDLYAIADAAQRSGVPS